MSNEGILLHKCSACRYWISPGEPSAIPRWLREQGADAIITGEMGRRAQQLFGENGIQVVAGASPEAPEDAVSAYLSGSLVVGNHPCQHRSCKDIPGTANDEKSTK